MNKIYSFVVLVALAGLWSCNDSTLIGSGSIIDTTTEVNFNDQADIQIKPIAPLTDKEVFPRDDCALPFATYLTNHNDPKFGSIYSQIYGQIALLSNVSIDSSLELAVVDSVVLRLAYGSTFNGDTVPEIELDVFKLSEVVDFEKTYSLDQTFMTEADPVSSLRFNPRPRTQRLLDTNLVAAYETFILDNRIGQELVNIDSSVLRNDTFFVEQFAGLNIRPKGDINPVLSFDLFNTLTQLNVYYNIGGETGVLPFKFYGNRVHFNQVIHDNTLGEIGGHIDSYTYGDTSVTVDALAGVESQITISNIDIVENNVINSAFLELTAIDYTEDITSFPPSQMLLYVVNSSGDRELTESALSSNLCAFLSGFDGMRSFDIQNGEKRFVYRFNISREIQNLVKNNTDSLIFYLSSYQNISSPSRLKAYGPKSAKFPLTLKISFTDF